jgi:hypothetical protein
MFSCNTSLIYVKNSAWFVSQVVFTIFTKDEEKDFVNHMTYMTRIGYGYSKAKIQLVGRDYAQALGKT